MSTVNAGSRMSADDNLDTVKFSQMAVTDMEEIIRQIIFDDDKAGELTLVHGVDENSLERVFHGLRWNTHLKILNLNNVGIHELGFRGLRMLLIHNVTIRYLRVVDKNLTVDVIEDLMYAAGVQSTLSKMEFYNPTQQLITTREDHRLRRHFAQYGVLKRYQLYSVEWYGVRLERFIPILS